MTRTRHPLGAPSPALLTPPGTYLLRPGALDFSNENDLPFMGEPSLDGQRSSWVAPAPSDDDPEGISVANDFGKRSAAAYFLFTQLNGTDALPLAWIASSMAESGDRTRAAQSSFWHHLSRLLWLGSHHLTPAAVAADVEAIIALDVEYAEADEIRAEQVAKKLG